MTLKKGKSEKTVSENISELMTTKPGTVRRKGIETLAKKRGISKKRAKQIQAIAISKNMQRQSNPMERDKQTTFISTREE